MALPSCIWTRDHFCWLLHIWASHSQQPPLHLRARRKVKVESHAWRTNTATLVEPLEANLMVRQVLSCYVPPCDCASVAPEHWTSCIAQEKSRISLETKWRFPCNITTQLWTCRYRLLHRWNSKCLRLTWQVYKKKCLDKIATKTICSFFPWRYSVLADTAVLLSVYV